MSCKMEQVTVYMIHKEHQQRVIEILLSLFGGITKPLVVFSNKNVHALQVINKDTNESDLFIATATESTAHIDILGEIKKGIYKYASESNVSESNAPDSDTFGSKAAGSNTPLLIGVYTTTMHSYSPMPDHKHILYRSELRHIDPYKEVNTMSIVMNEVVKSENGVYSDFPNTLDLEMDIWKCKSLFAFRINNHLKVFADPCTLANIIYTHMPVPNPSPRSNWRRGQKQS